MWEDTARDGSWARRSWDPMWEDAQRAGPLGRRSRRTGTHPGGLRSAGASTPSMTDTRRPRPPTRACSRRGDTPCSG